MFDFTHHRAVILFGRNKGSAGHWHCICNADPTIAVALNNLRLKLPPSKGKPANKLELCNPKLPPKFNIPTFKFLSPLLLYPVHLSPCCTIGIISFFACTILPQPSQVTCNLACPRSLHTKQDNSEKDDSSHTRCV